MCRAIKQVTRAKQNEKECQNAQFSWASLNIPVLEAA
ncbi:hypothetical protein DMW06_12865 [Vibrio parahaemolyticus]|nr:hypothetical protein [Vibrio parahaemolyticus]